MGISSDTLLTRRLPIVTLVGYNSLVAIDSLAAIDSSIFLTLYPVLVCGVCVCVCFVSPHLIVPFSVSVCLGCQTLHPFLAASPMIEENCREILSLKKAV